MTNRKERNLQCIAIQWEQYQEDYPEELRGWTLETVERIEGSIKTLGRANYRTKTIQLSPEYIRSGLLIHLLDTLGHEVAHALAPMDGHGSRWRAVCKTLGVNPRAISQVKKAMSEDYMKEHYNYYLATIDGDKVVAGWGRKPKYTSGYKVGEYKSSELYVISKTDYELKYIVI